ncbi:hypothetical protein BDR26DRAFT_941326 [Obelidium mucronatum]|nr:hypothetical protein BDR26DRAFT_941326 [Obelidium mucronatum]
MTTSTLPALPYEILFAILSYLPIHFTTRLRLLSSSITNRESKAHHLHSQLLLTKNDVLANGNRPGNDYALDSFFPECLYWSLHKHHFQRQEYCRLRWTDEFLNCRIPRAFESLNALKELSLVNCGLWGPIPVELTRLNHLETLTLSKNSLSDSLPKEIGNLGNTLRVLNLQENRLVGLIPSELGDLVELEVLLLDSNHFSGKFPREVRNLRKLKRFYCFGNAFRGDIPWEGVDLTVDFKWRRDF